MSGIDLPSARDHHERRANARPIPAERLQVPRRCCDAWDLYAHALLGFFLARAFDLTRIGTLSPSIAGPLVSTGEGDPTTQIVTLIMAAAALPLVVRNKDAARAALAGLWPVLLLVVWSWASVSWAIASDIAMRRIALTTLVIWSVYGPLAQLRAPEAVMHNLMAVTAAVVVADYLVLAFEPSVAIAYGTDVQGIHASKNDAGAVMMMAILAWTAGLASARGPLARTACAAIVVAAVGYLHLTTSKTSLIVLMPALAIAVLFRQALRLGRPFLAMGAALAMGGVTMIALPFAFLRPDVVFEQVFGDPTFTGRTVIWDFVVGFAERHPWTGVGYGSFWNIGPRGPTEQQGYGVIRQVGEGHNGYLDLAATTGCIGLALGVVVLFWPFVRLFTRAMEREFRTRDSIATTLMVAYLAAGIFHNLTESSLLRGAHPVWVLTLVAMIVVAFLSGSVVPATPLQPRPVRKPSGAPARRPQLPWRDGSSIAPRASKR